VLAVSSESRQPCSRKVAKIIHCVAGEVANSQHRLRLGARMSKRGAKLFQSLIQNAQKKSRINFIISIHTRNSYNDVMNSGTKKKLRIDVTNPARTRKDQYKKKRFDSKRL